MLNLTAYVEDTQNQAQYMLLFHSVAKKNYLLHIWVKSAEKQEKILRFGNELRWGKPKKFPISIQQVFYEAHYKISAALQELCALGEFRMNIEGLTWNIIGLYSFVAGIIFLIAA